MRSSSKLRNVSDALRSKTPTLGRFHREKGRDFAEAYISLWLIYLNDILNVRRGLTEAQIELCAQTIVDEYYALKISDISLLSRRLISGEYGELYESLTINKVLSFFQKYMEERLNTAADESLRAHRDMMSDETFNFTSNIKRLYVQKSAKGFHSKK